MEYKWFTMWVEDKESMITTMEKNIVADLEAGYNPFGESIKKARMEVMKYAEEFDEQMKMLREMDYKQAEHWCYVDMKRRGAIS